MRVEELLRTVGSTKNKSLAFETVAFRMNLKPGSVRNFYYSGAWRKYTVGCEEITVKKFNKFTQLEVLRFMRAVILGYSRGESLRSVCMQYAGRDLPRMLRYQNKYRTIFAKNPELVEELVATLSSEGYLVKNPLGKICKVPKSMTTPDNIITMPQVSADKELSDQDLQNLFMGLIRLVRKQNQSQIVTMRAEIERLTKMLRHTSEH